MMNIYSGNLILNEAGEGDVFLPEWFQALNEDFRYQLTCIGGSSPVHWQRPTREELAAARARRPPSAHGLSCGSGRCREGAHLRRLSTNAS